MSETNRDKCSACGVEMEPGQNACANCGTVRPYSSDSIQTRVCSKCGQSTSNLYAVCLHCGARLANEGGQLSKKIITISVLLIAPGLVFSTCLFVTGEEFFGLFGLTLTVIGVTLIILNIKKANKPKS